jgi:hypothetical protein
MSESERDYSKQPLPWSVMFGSPADDNASPDMSDATATPHGFRVAHKRSTANCRHEGNPPGYTWCKHCGTRIV